MNTLHLKCGPNPRTRRAFGSLRTQGNECWISTRSLVCPEGGVQETIIREIMGYEDTATSLLAVGLGIHIRGI